MQIKIEVSAERAETHLTIDDLIAIDEIDEDDFKVADLKAIKSVLGKFVLGEDGEYLDPVEGMNILGLTTTGQLMVALASFMKEFEETAAKKKNGMGSEEQSNSPPTVETPPTGP